MAAAHSLNPPQGPLKGIKVLDLCSAIAGAYSAMLMGDLGAEVIKLEAPEGDQSRTWGPFYQGEGKLFQGWNRNKRSLVLDVRIPAAAEVLYRLIPQTDVLIENFRPGVTEKLKIDYGTLSKLNPRLIYCSTTGFGAKGPDRLRPGYDPILQAMSGGAAANVNYSGVVSISSIAAVDFSTAYLIFGGVNAALYHRALTGEGQRIETSLLQGAIAIQSHAFFQALNSEPEGPTGICPNRLFKTKDSYIQIVAPTNKFWRILCQTLGDDDLAQNPRYATNPLRCAYSAEWIPKIEAHLQTKPTEEWEKLFLEKDLPCGPVWTFDRFFNSEQVTAMGMNPVIHHSKLGEVRVGGVPLDFEKTPGVIQRAAPVLGEHTTEILRELGYSDSEIEALRPPLN